jgi:UDP-glucuronate 4-epimerase
MKILVTGAAGFIGFHTCLKLAGKDHDIVGLDNLNPYYDVQLKTDRLTELGIHPPASGSREHAVSSRYPGLRFSRVSLEQKEVLTSLFEQEEFDLVIHLAAQAGVRYSLENPESYIDSNISGFFNVLEACRRFPVKHLIFASSSSVYGLNEKKPFSPGDNTDHPISLYAATKKSNELMAYTYHHLFGIPVTGLRFFTAYGPWGRPDMAYFSFTERILNKKEIRIFNHGNQERDFTFIDDIVEGICQLMDRTLSEPEKFQYGIYNLGNHKPVRLIEFIEILESLLGEPAIRNYQPMQPGDVMATNADIQSSMNDFGYHPHTGIREGLKIFVDWFRTYYKL